MIPIGDDVPDTARFQILFAPNGRCRIVLFADDAGEPQPIATLTLEAADADEMGRTLTQRREAYAQAETTKSSKKH
ncbi:hypothetical protein BV511_03080 [Methylorubrum extorquens]|nr:hypothetical protein BV511_03080 [Methylorubrum extorquens]